LGPINTIAFELTDNAAEEIDSQREQRELDVLHKLKIDKLESCYNYRTLGDGFLVVTSVLSNSEICIPVKEKSNPKFLFSTIYRF